MSQGLALDRVGCARNAGIFILLRILIGSLIFLSMGTLFYLPTEAMLPAIVSIKENLLLFILIVIALIPLSFFSLVFGLPLSNALESVNKKFSFYASRVRIVEALIFIIGMVLLIIEIPLFYQVMLLGMILYGVHLIIVGDLGFISGFLNRISGLLLIIGGAAGYLLGSLIGFLATTLILYSAIGIALAILSEVILAINLITTAKRTTFSDPDSKSRLRRILKNLGEATTAEIVAEATKDSDECKDRAPRTLRAMELDGEVTKKFSKEKKGFVWSLT